MAFTILVNAFTIFVYGRNSTLFSVLALTYNPTVWTRKDWIDVAQIAGGFGQLFGTLLTIFTVIFAWWQIREAQKAGQPQVEIQVTRRRKPEAGFVVNIININNIPVYVGSFCFRVGKVTLYKEEIDEMAEIYKEAKEEFDPRKTNLIDYVGFNSVLHSGDSCGVFISEKYLKRMITGYEKSQKKPTIAYLEIMTASSIPNPYVSFWVEKFVLSDTDPQEQYIYYFKIGKVKSIRKFRRDRRKAKLFLEMEKVLKALLTLLKK